MCLVDKVALVVSAVMFAFSAWMFSQTGDWVALVFMVMSAGYGVLFMRRGRNRSHDPADGSGE